MPGDTEDSASLAAAFDAHRGLLFTVAYNILGSVGDAEDVVQDAWLKWSRVAWESVDDPRAYLVRVVTNCAIDQLRLLRRSREEYVGPWLPEPLWAGPDPAETVVGRDAVAVGMLVVLETLTPLERTAFVLHEVFGFAHAEVADVLGRSPAAVRQLLHRSREHVHARRPRFDVARSTADRAARRFLDAAVGGDLNELLDVLAPDVVLHTDGGGAVRAALRPIEGAEKVARLFAHIGTHYAGSEFRWGSQGGVPTAAALSDGALYAVLSIESDHAGRVTAIYGNLNPSKLARFPTSPGSAATQGTEHR